MLVRAGFLSSPTIQLWNQPSELDRDGARGQRYCSLDDVYDARVAHLGMPHYVVNRTAL